MHHDGFGDFDLNEHNAEMARVAANFERAQILDLNVPLKNQSEYPTRGQAATPPRTEDELRKEKQLRHSRIYDDTIHLSVDTQLGYSSTKQKERFPTEPRMAVIYNRQYSYDSGYGHNGAADNCTGTSTEIEYFLTDEALEDWVIKATKDRKTFRVVQITPVETEVKAVFSVKK
jgi:hypothetical protein